MQDRLCDKGAQQIARDILQRRSRVLHRLSP
jgi:hypothetical protein